MFRVYQIVPTAKEYAAFNRGEEVDSLEVKRLMSFRPEDFEISFAEYYDAACEVDTDNLAECFKLMNLWNERSRVKFLKEEVHSMSIGDLVEDMETGVMKICARAGFMDLPQR